MSVGLNFPSVLQAARLGAEWAWTELYRDLSPSVLRYLRAHGAGEPEDVLGETFVQVVKRLPDFHGGEDEFRAWVFAIARSRLIDMWRAQARRPAEHMPEEILTCRPAADDTEQETLRSLAYDRVTASLARLTDAQRDVVFLRIIAGLSIEQVAQIVDKPTGAVKSLQARGLSALRRHMSADAGPEISGEAVS